MDPQLTKIPTCHADKIEHFDSNTSKQWTILTFTPNSNCSYLIDICTSKITDINSLPLSLSHSQPIFNTSHLELSKENKAIVMQKNFQKCSCHEVNKIIKNYVIVNLDINYISGVEYEIVGYQNSAKLYANNQFTSILQMQFDGIKKNWQDYDSLYCRSLSNKKNGANKAENVCDLLPFVQVNVQPILAPNVTTQIGFSQRNLCYRRIPVIFNLNQELADKQIDKKIMKITNEQMKMQNTLKRQKVNFPIIGAFKGKSTKIFNPHIFATPTPKPNFQLITVKGMYEYYHYGDQNFTDNGWGCAYRALQTLLSWLNMQGYLQPLNEGMISLRDIQQRLDMIDRTRKLKGSSEWIGATEISWIVPKMTPTHVNCKILHVSDGKKILQKCEEFKQHFLTSGCPIMYGGGQYAYSIVGMYYNWKLGECEFLILDPHYTGEDDYGKILQKKGLAWRKPEQMFKKGIFYNFCLPIVD